MTETTTTIDPVQRAVMMYVDGFKYSTDFASRHMSRVQFYGKAVREGYISEHQTSFGYRRYELTDKGRKVAAKIYAEPLMRKDSYGAMIRKIIGLCPNPAVETRENPVPDQFKYVIRDMDHPDAVKDDEIWAGGDNYDEIFAQCQKLRTDSRNIIMEAAKCS